MSYCVVCVCLRIVMSNVMSYNMLVCSEFRVVMSSAIFRMKTTFKSFLPPVVCRRAHVFDVCLRGVQHELLILITWQMSYKRQ
jgi:hypothetical protein